jgi:hypothetical protein
VTYNPVGESVFPVAELTEFRWPGSVTCGYEYSTTVVIDRSPMAELNVQLISDDPSLVQVPAPTVPIKLGATSASITLTTTALPLPFAPKPVNVHATYAGKTLTINVELWPPQVSQITLDRDTVTCGESVTATVTLNWASKLGSVEVDLLSASAYFASLSPPGSAPLDKAKLVIPQDKISRTFVISCPDHPTPFKTAHSWIEAKYAGSSAHVVLTIRPRVLLGLLKSVTVFPKTVQGGGVSRGTVTLEEEVPVDTKVLLKALDPAMGPQGPLPLPGSPSSSAHVRSFVTIKANQISETFPVTTTQSNWPHDRRVVRIEARAVTHVKYATLVID